MFNIFTFLLFFSCDFNKYTLQYVAHLGETLSKKENNEPKMEVDSEEENDLEIREPSDEEID